MIVLEELYFDWLLTKLDEDGVEEGVAYVGGLLHNCHFLRRVGNDMNRAIDGVKLREEFLRRFDQIGFEPHVTNDFLTQECSWFEMLVSLAQHMDYIYDGGVETHFIEMITNAGLGSLTIYDPDHDNYDSDQSFVDGITSGINENTFDRNGHGGIFPLYKKGHSDQRRVEIWDQHAAYFSEKLEGVLWTSTS